MPDAASPPISSGNLDTETARAVEEMKDPGADLASGQSHQNQQLPTAFAGEKVDAIGLHEILHFAETAIRFLGTVFPQHVNRKCAKLPTVEKSGWHPSLRSPVLRQCIEKA